MAAIAIPLYGMYELSIVTVRFFGGPYSRGQDREPAPAPVETDLGPPPAP